jgi:hypothetical protein
MESKSFFNALRKIIREEVQLAVRTEMKRMLTENKTDHKKVIQHGLELNRITEKPVTKKTYSKDPLLNDLLNETATVPAEQWPTMDFRSEMAQAFGGMRQHMDSDIPFVAPATDINGSPVNMSNEKVATAVNAMTKDYSALMKAIDKKKGVK